jgi:hypothetical protein
VANNFQTGNNKIKLLTEYESAIQRFYLATLYSQHRCLGENMTLYLKMATLQEKAMCVLWFFETKSVIKMQRRYKTQYAIRRWLKQFQETGNVLHRKGAGRQSTSQEDVDRIQEAFSRSPQKSMSSIAVMYTQKTVWRVVHSIGNKTF